jgi:hypothetical protein
MIDFLKRVEGVIWNRTFLRSEGKDYEEDCEKLQPQRLFGLAPDLAEPRHLICILLGCGVLELQLYCIQRLINSISGIGTNVSVSLKPDWLMWMWQLMSASWSKYSGLSVCRSPSLESSHF